MGALGRKTPPLSEEARKAQEKGRLASRGRQIRFRGGRYATAEQVKQALTEGVGQYLSVLDDLALTAEDARVRMDAARYLIDRVAGKPTEKVQQEVSTKPAVMPSEEQLEALAKRALGRADEGTRESPIEGEETVN